jgi:hypothetical protein
MMKTLKALILAVGMFAISSLPAEDTLVDKNTGKSFPAQVSFDFNGKNYELDATGIATRTKFFVKVYSVAHYLQKSNDVNKNTLFNIIFSDDRAKQLSMVWVRDVDSRTIRDGYLDTFKKVFSPQQQQQLQPQIDQFLDFFSQSAKVGDEHVIRWIPGGFITVEINGESKGQVQNVDFAKAVWGIWLGAKSVVQRNQLVSRIN